MQLRADPRLPREGAVSVRRPADEVVLCEISFSWISAQVFGRAPPGFDASAPLVPFITRNQSVHGSHPSLREFETQFPHHSPKYLCLAALHRVCGTQGVSWVAGIRHECQIAFDPVHGESFNYSCTRLWLSPGGVPLGPHALAMRSPLALPPLSQVGAKHRKRAEARRWLRGRINTAAEKVVRQHLQAG
jgi:hypothetical protein